MKACVVIPAFQAGATLERCISALRKQDGVERIIVVDDGGNPDFSELQKRYDLEIVDSNQSGSAAAARNCGAKRSSEEILIFIDADVIVDEGALAKLIAPIKAELADATVGNYSDRLEKLNFYEAYKQLYIHQIYSRTSGFIYNEYWTAIGAVRRSVFNELDGFKESFMGASGEDTDFGLRLSDGGFSIFSVAQAQGAHLSGLTLTTTIDNDFKKGKTSVVNAIRNRNSLRNNRHSQSRDIFAVAAAFITIASLLTLLLEYGLNGTAISSFALSSSILAFFAFRLDLLKAYFQRGAAFGLRSLLLCFVLDLVRAAAVLCGLLEVARDLLLSDRPRSKHLVKHGR